MDNKIDDRAGQTSNIADSTKSSSGKSQNSKSKLPTDTNNNNRNGTPMSNNTHSNNNASSSGGGSSQKPSSSTSSSNKQYAVNADDSSTGEGGDDVGWWDCSLCTYRNSADKFKCEICDLRRGTSTRKPRCNADTIVAQVVKQQEQIRQQTRAKPPKVRSNTSSGSNTNQATSSTEPDSKLVKTKNLKTPQDSSKSKLKNGATSSRDVNTGDESDEVEESIDSPKPKKKKSKNDSKNNRQKSSSSTNNKNRERNAENESYASDDSTDSENTDVSDTSRTSSPQIHRSASESSIDTSNYSSSSSTSPEPTPSSPLASSNVTDNPFKVSPIEVNGNLIKYSPPTSSGRTGLIIDKKRFTQHSVTVNDVTITFTEFATRQNKYVRKKKRRRDGSRIRN